MRQPLIDPVGFALSFYCSVLGETIARSKQTICFKAIVRAAARIGMRFITAATRLSGENPIQDQMHSALRSFIEDGVVSAIIYSVHLAGFHIDGFAVHVEKNIFICEYWNMDTVGMRKEKFMSRCSDISPSGNKLTRLARTK